MSRFSSRSLVVVLALVTLGGIATADPARPRRGRPHQQVPSGADDNPGAAAPDARLEAELEVMTSRSSDGLVPVARADGTVAVDLEGRFMSVMVVGPRGTACHTGQQAVDSARAKPPRGKHRVRKPGRRVTPPPSPAIPALEVM